MASRPGSRVVIQLAGTVAVAVVVTGVFANLRDEPAAVPAGEQTQVRGIAASDLRRDVVAATPTGPVQKPVAEAKPEPRKAPRREAAKPQDRQHEKQQDPARIQVATTAVAPTVVSVDPGPPLPLAPAQTADDPSFVLAAGRTSLAVLRSSTDFVTSTVPRAVVSTTRVALDRARSIGSAVLDKVTP